MIYFISSITVTLLLCSPTSLANNCWSVAYLIEPEHELTFQECKSEGKVRIGNIEVTPTIEFELIGKHWPEGKSIWSKFSPNDKTAFVWIEGRAFTRNAWIIDLDANTVKLFIDHAEGRHFSPDFKNDNQLVVTHAGMGYKIDFIYRKQAGEWKFVDRIEHQVDL